ncbi:MAG: hypothetical protein WBV63_15670, partial [Candidatus Sulfotelmatobacter sp.]
MPYHNLHIIDISMRAPHPSSTLLEAFENQDEAFAPAFAILQEAINQQAFPAASVAVTHGGSLVARKALGSVTPKAGAPSFSRSLREGGDFDFAIAPATLFDLA